MILPKEKHDLEDYLHIISKENDISGFCPSYSAAERLLVNSYCHLEEDISPKEFFSATIEKMNSFLGMVDQDKELWPEFMLHGIQRKKLSQVLDKIHSNQRVMLETIKERKYMIGHYGIRMHKKPGMKSDMCDGTAECELGVWHSLLDKDSTHLGFEYHAKIGFFLDTTNKEAYILSVQGKNSRPRRGNNFGKITRRIGIDPREFLLNELTDFLQGQGYESIKAIKPEEHPFAIIKHWGYKGTHKQVIVNTGFNEKKEYFEKYL